LLLGRRAVPTGPSDRSANPRLRKGLHGGVLRNRLGRGHHDIALVDGEGKLIAKRRIEESVNGLAELTAMLAAAGDSAEEPIPVGIETPRGLLVAALRTTGRPIYPINPLAVARYRERTSLSGKKNDHVDAMALANILRTDAHLCCRSPKLVLARIPCYCYSAWRRGR
jgi:Transposase